MKRRILIHRLAELEINRAIIWYAENAGLGREVRADVKATIAKIRKNPLTYPISFQQARRALLDQFPYRIFFVIESNSVVKVYAVLHTSQDTNRLVGRLP